jgi:quinoprotein glucose dehydrogenase
MSSILLLLGIVFVAGGVWLAALGGSLYYLIAGVAIALSGWLLLRRRATGLILYALTLLGTVGWALWEVGFDWWAQSARESLLIIIGALLLLPPMGRSLQSGAKAQARGGPSSGILLLALLISCGVAEYSTFNEPHDIAGSFGDAKMAASKSYATDGVPDGEWQAYGRTNYGQRYSPLDQINAENAAQLEVAWTYETGQTRASKDPGETTYEDTPLIIDDTMFVCTPFATVIALVPETGKEKWRFDPQLKQPPTRTTQHMTCRGVSYFDGSRHPRPATVTAQTEPSHSLSAAADKTRILASAAEVTTAAAGVAENIVNGFAKPGAPNPEVDRKENALPTAAISDSCVKRLFVPTSDGRLISISARTGDICPGFGGEDGTINLWANMPNVTPGSAYSTSPPIVTDHLVIVGGAVNDNSSTTSPSGVIRAFDVFTGKLVWNFDSKKPDQTQPIANGETYSANAPNSWSVSSYDPDLGLIFVPMGNESPDQYGANRSAAVEKFSSAVTALDAETGKVRWVYQTVHHDLWDMDVPAQPSLIDLTVEGKPVHALVQPTKQGDVYVLNRETGEPIFPVKEVDAPKGAVEGDFTAPTQPVSSITFKPEPLKESDMWGVTPIDQLVCRISFLSHVYRGRFTPPTKIGSIIYPGNFGTFNWGAVAVDPQRQLMFAMPVYLAFTAQLVPRPNETARVLTHDGDSVFNENLGAPYAAKMGAFLSPIGLACQQPPWGYVAGVDLSTGKTVYKHVNGTVRDLTPLPLPFEMGVPGIGGPIVTKGGVAFLSGTLDNYVRGYDLETGREIWRERLPAGGQATPSTYLGSDGRQYLVVVAGGHGSTGTKAGDFVIAYALPKGSVSAAKSVSQSNGAVPASRN